MKEVLEMSKKELDRYSIVQQAVSKQITHRKAAELLDISERQFRNILTSYKQEGPRGLISKKRGKQGNRHYKPELKNQIIALVSEKYPDFGPTFAKEKLQEYHKLKISDETLRKWMIEHHLWVPRTSQPKIHRSRPRRDCFGELIQIDASIHCWFEDRADKCALIVYIDDATSKITSMFFCKTECLEGYFVALKNHIEVNGRPRAIYSDRHSIFGGGENMHHAQFTRALKELNIESILARSPQAKGRVERANRTLQDRLVKELRLRNISNIEDANRYLGEFINVFNKNFSKEPRAQFDAHRPLDSSLNLEWILARCEERTLSKDLSFSFYNKKFNIVEPLMINRLKRKRILIRQKYDGSLKVFFDDKELKYMLAEECIDDRKLLDIKEKQIWVSNPGGHPGTHHPWRIYGNQMRLANKLSKSKKEYNGC